MLFQLALAADFAECLCQHTDERWAAASEAFLRQVNGALHSATAFVEREAGIDREEVFGGWYLGRQLDPHVAGEAALTAG